VVTLTIMVIMTIMVFFRGSEQVLRESFTNIRPLQQRTLSLTAKHVEVFWVTFAAYKTRSKMSYLLKNTNVFLFSAVIIASCGGNKAPEREPRAHPVVQVESRDVDSFQSYPASVQGVNNNEVRSKIQGYIRQVLVDEGQYVSKGQVMFRLETDVLSQDESAARSGVSAARARVEAAQAEVDKLKPLVEQGIVGAVLTETARANLAHAASELERAEASHKSIRSNVDYSVIRSPMDGVVGKINLRTGSLASPGDNVPITTVSDIGEMYAYFSMSEAEYLDFLEETAGRSLPDKLRNMPLPELELANGKTYPQKGRISAVTGQVDPQTGSISFRASFPNKDRILAHGNSGRIRLPKTRRNATVVPETAVFERQGKTYAAKVTNGTVDIVEIQIAARIDNLALVENGLRPGDTVVASGMGRLRTGMAISVGN